MHSIPVPFFDAEVLFSAHWRQLPVVGQIALVLFGLLLPTAVVLLYRYELRLVKMPIATILLGLRLLSLIFLLFVIFLQPVWARRKSEALQGRVMVAIDRSNSIKVGDPQRPNVEKLRLARALKLADAVTDQQLVEWIKEYEEKGVPQFVKPDELANDPAGRQRLSDSRQKLHDKICETIDKLTRAGVVQRLLAEGGPDLLGALAEKHKIEVVGFSQEIWDVKPEQLSELLAPFAQAQSPPAAGADKKKADDKKVEDKDRARDDATDIRLPLSRALERSGKTEGKILGVVLLTDGQHNKNDLDSRSPVDKAIEMGNQEIPIYPIVLGARQSPPDVAVASVQAPPATFKDTDVSVEARVKVSGIRKQDIQIELQRPGEPALHETIHHDGNDHYYTVRFNLKLDKVGAQTLTVTAKPVDGEIRQDNNSRPVVVNVADDKAKVLLVDGEARWEFHYLASALRRDKQMQLSNIVFNQPRLGRVPEEDLEKIGNPKLAWPTDPDALASYDCIVLGDVSPAQLPASERARLEKYVSDRGGTLVILAGKRFMPLGFTDPRAPAKPLPNGRGPENGASDKEETDPLLRLLPIQQPRVVTPTKGFPITFTAQGRLSKFLEMDSSAEQNAKTWAELPHHYWGVIGKVKPGATSLAYVSTEDGAVPDANVPADEKEPGRNHALIVRQNYGFGRVLYVGLDSTWRWRFRRGDTYHHRFWSQVIHWAAADKPLIAGNDHVRFGTREPVYRQGTEIDLVARLSDNEKPLPADALAGARVLRLTGEPNGKNGEEQVALIPLKRKPAQPRLLEAKVPPYLAPGQYSVELAIPELAGKLEGPPGADAKPGKLRANFSVLPSESEETIELAANWPLLEELATKSGGKALAPEDAMEVVELLSKKVITREQLVETRLWETWGMLFLFLFLVTVEWVVRKLVGLP
jgi:hypothetical protein